MEKVRLSSAFALLLVTLCASADEVSLTAEGELARPADYRQWVFVSSGLGMTYGPARPEPGQPPHFTNVFVNPQAYQAFMESGHWPDRTFFIMEIRRSEQHVSINSGGYTQGDLVTLEASVKDRARFPGDGWKFFAFDDQREVAAPLPNDTSCYGCHSRHGAVEWTFTQFYPDLLAVARRFGSIRDDYDAAQQLD
jgi:Cytochrome P460